MIIIDDILDISPALSYTGTPSDKKVLFFDIETTGFAALSTQLYLIGCIYYENNTWKLRQWFVEDHNEEKECLKAFSDFLKNFTTLIHFNGNGFDIPYLTKKYGRYKLKAPFDSLTSIDIYKCLMPYKKFLKLDSLKQKSVEQFLQINREDRFNGGELIYVYFDYLERKKEEALQLLLLHNREDLIGMTGLLPALAYTNLTGSNPKLSTWKIYDSVNFDNISSKELYLEFTTDFDFPVPISQRQANNIVFIISENRFKLLIPINECELKFFYSNCKDYYYLPYEDAAMHKSVAQFVDKNYRTQAKASNCYTKKQSAFIPLPSKDSAEKLDCNCFRGTYESKELFCELDFLLKGYSQNPDTAEISKDSVYLYLDLFLKSIN